MSSLSNLSNRPGRIQKIKVLGNKIPKPALKPLKEEGKDEEGSGDSDEEVVEIPEAITHRAKDETAEEKRARKASVKEMKKVCRQMKKESKETYKKEAMKMAGSAGGSDIRQGQRLMKL